MPSAISTTIVSTSLACQSDLLLAAIPRRRTRMSAHALGTVAAAARRAPRHRPTPCQSLTPRLAIRWSTPWSTFPIRFSSQQRLELAARLASQKQRPPNLRHSLLVVIPNRSDAAPIGDTRLLQRVTSTSHLRNRAGALHCRAQDARHRPRHYVQAPPGTSLASAIAQSTKVRSRNQGHGQRPRS